VAGDEKDKLVEYNCDSEGYGKKNIYTCPYGCSNGVCIACDASHPDYPDCDGDGEEDCNANGECETGESLSCIDCIDSIDSTDQEGDATTSSSGSSAGSSTSAISCPTGCSLNGKCYQIGHRKSGEYCFEDGTFVDQLEEGEFCENNFECDSNVCVGSQCISSNFIQRFLQWLQGLF
jgi:hypothetical protein